MAKAGSFSFKIVSTSDNAKTIALIPGTFRVLGYSGADFAGLTLHYHDVTELTNSGLSVDLVLDDGVIDASAEVTVTALNTKYRVRHFLEFIKTNPQRCTEIVVQASDTDQYNELLQYKQDSAFANLGDLEIRLADYFSNRQFNTDKIVVPVNMLLSDQTLLLFTIPGGGRTTTISFNKLVSA